MARGDVKWRRAKVMVAMVWVAGAAGGIGAVEGAFGQFVPRVPEKSPAAPEYVPPAPPAPPPTPRPETNPSQEAGKRESEGKESGKGAEGTQPAPEPLPSLVERGENGKVKAVSQHPELAALALMSLGAEEQERVVAALGKRQGELEDRVSQNPEVAIHAKRKIDALGEEKDVGALLGLRQKIAPITASSTPMEYLSREGALPATVRARVEQVVKEYDEALRAEWEKEYGTDAMGIVGAIAREKNRQAMFEPVAAWNRLIARGGGGLKELSEDAGLTSEIREKLAGVAKKAAGKSAEETTRAFEEWLENQASEDERKSVMVVVAGKKGT